MRIYGSEVNADALKSVKSLADLKKLEIFSHLEDEDAANAELWAVLRPPKEEKKEKVEKPD